MWPRCKTRANATNRRMQIGQTGKLCLLRGGGGRRVAQLLLPASASSHTMPLKTDTRNTLAFVAW